MINKLNEMAEDLLRILFIEYLPLTCVVSIISILSFIVVLSYVAVQ